MRGFREIYDDLVRGYYSTGQIRGSDGGSVW